MQKLGKRLSYVAQEIGKVKSIADIGTDHGILIIYALEHGLADRAFAVDISSKSLAKAKNLACETGLDEMIDFFCGDGLDPLLEIPDVIIIAGMGGNEIVKILSNKKLLTKYILVPHQDAKEVRKYLVDNGFCILKDYIIFDEKFYPIIVAQPGKCEYSKSEIVLGANKPPTEWFALRVQKRKQEIDFLLEKNNALINQLKPEIREEYEECARWLASNKL